MTASAILVVTGASGAGKTASVRALDARAVPGIRCFHFDTIGVPSPEEMERDHGGGEQWQASATAEWLARLGGLPDDVRVAVLDGQTRPSFVFASAARATPRHVHVVLLDCDPSVRAARLRGPRGQPELATDRMDHWAVYLRGQADALNVPVIDTSELAVSDVAERLAAMAQEIAARTDGAVDHADVRRTPSRRDSRARAAEVRVAEPSDAEHISALAAEVQMLHAVAHPGIFRPAGPHTFPPSAIRERMATPGHLFWVAVADGVIAGYAYATLRHEPETPWQHAATVCTLDQMGVAPAYRRHGAGAGLVEAVRRVAAEHGAREVRLDVWAFNDSARAFYRRCGFVTARERMWLPVGQ